VQRFVKEYQIPLYDAQLLTQSKDLAEYFETTSKISGNPKSSSNWIMVELLRDLNEKKIEVRESPIPAEALAELIQLIDKGTISGKIAKTVFKEMFETKKSAQVIVKEKNLVQVSDTKAIEAVIERIVGENPEQVAQYRAGKEKVFGFFVGQIMKEMKGQANPAVVNDLLRKKL
jgi:aspartyl-tRNA(Asn)/glutamyl-tRNA(Gln) amidotransferase subunit B